MNELQKKYLEPVMTLIKIETDVITTSSVGEFQTNGVYDVTGDWGGFEQ